MAGWVVLMGGDEFTSGCEEMDSSILRAAAKTPRVVIVPTAAAGQNPSKAASNGVGYFRGLGVQASSLMVLERTAANDNEFLRLVDIADLIYLTGGDPSHLLTTIHNSLLLEKLLCAVRRGAIVAGSSAAAMVMGSWLRLDGRWIDALGLLPNVAVLPHHENNNPNEITGQLSSTSLNRATVLGLDSMTCCFGGSTGWKVLGSGSVTVYYLGRWTRYRNGANVPLPLVVNTILHKKPDTEVKS